MNPSEDVAVLRELAQQVAEISALPVQEERRQLWSAHFSLKPVRPPIHVDFGMWNDWCQDVFSDAHMVCTDPFYREHERGLRVKLFHHAVGDDYIVEPWITQSAVFQTPRDLYGGAWGAPPKHVEPDTPGGAWKEYPAIEEWSEVARLVPPPHRIDEAETARQADRLHAAVGDILEVDVKRGTLFWGLAGDISTTMGGLIGIERMMLDMYESPDNLKHLATVLRDGILQNEAAVEAAGDYSLTAQMNQSETYADELERPHANSGPRLRKDLWGFAASQEFTLVSPAFHEAFLFEFQRPILEAFGLVHYGCCENLTGKIDMLRQLPNLRSIAVTPSADLAQCAAQIGNDYAISWRPNPTNMVCAGWDEDRIHGTIRDGLRFCQGQHLHITLKDVETLQGEPDRLARWTSIVRQCIDRYWN